MLHREPTLATSSGSRRESKKKPLGYVCLKFILIAMPIIQTNRYVVHIEIVTDIDTHNSYNRDITYTYTQVLQTHNIHTQQTTLTYFTENMFCVHLTSHVRLQFLL